MRKSLKIVVPILIISLLGYFGYGTFTKIKQKNEVAERIDQIPDFSFKTLENQDFVKSSLESGTPTIFLFFNGECENCQEEAEQINKSISEFKSAQLIFVSNEPIEKVAKFAEGYNLMEHANVHVLLDSNNDFNTLFGATSIPYTLVYDKNLNLVEKFTGYVKIENLIKAIQ